MLKHIYSNPHKGRTRKALAQVVILYWHIDVACVNLIDSLNQVNNDFNLPERERALSRLMPRPILFYRIKYV